MAIFSRRTLQRLLDENQAFLTEEQLTRHVKALNRADEQSLCFEWEVVLLNAFSKFGSVLHEPGVRRSRKPDLIFHPGRALESGFSADIATVSLQGREESNPLWYFQTELLKRVRKAGLDGRRFRMRIEGDLRGSRDKQVMQLRLPSRREASAFFDVEFKEFLRGCRALPDRCHRFVRQSGDVDAEIAFDPKQPYFSMSFPSYNVSYSPTRNPVANALKPKARQLRDAQAPHPWGILLCSVDVPFRHGVAASSTSAVDVGVIIRTFLKQHSSISFVLALSSEAEGLGDESWPKPMIKTRLYLQDMSDEVLDRETRRCLEHVQTVIPPPVNTGLNALHHVRGPCHEQGRSFYGGLRMTHDTVRISSRAILDLLAGRVSQERFLADHGFARGRPSVFEMWLNQGRTIKGIALERQVDCDDDWLTFTFGPPDAAVSKFGTSRQTE